MKNIKLYTFLIFILYLSSGCGWSKPVIEPESPPFQQPLIKPLESSSTDSYRLIPGVMENDKIRVQLWISQNLIVDQRKMVAGKIAINQGKHIHTRDIDFVDRILKIKDGIPVKLKRTYNKALRKRVELSLEDELLSDITQPMPFHGQTLIMENINEEVVCAVESEGDISPDEIDRVLLDRVTFIDFLPPTPVSIGASWEVSPEKFVYLFEKKEMRGGKYEGKITVKFQGLAEYKGEKAAWLKIKTDIVYSQEFEKPGTVSSRQLIKVEGDLYYSIQKNLPLYLRLKGPVRSEWIDPAYQTPHAAVAEGETEVMILYTLERS